MLKPDVLRAFAGFISRWTVYVFLFSILSGCHSMVWEKQGVTPFDAQTALAQCRYKVLKMLTTNGPRIVINNTNNTGDNNTGGNHPGWLASFVAGYRTGYR